MPETKAARKAPVRKTPEQKRDAAAAAVPGLVERAANTLLSLVKAYTVSGYKSRAADSLALWQQVNELAEDDEEEPDFVGGDVEAE